MAIRMVSYLSYPAEELDDIFYDLIKMYPNGFKDVEIVKNSGFYDMFIVYDDGN